MNVQDKYHVTEFSAAVAVSQELLDVQESYDERKALAEVLGQSAYSQVYKAVMANYDRR